MLRAKANYTCAKHPQKPAFCLCAKCGSFLCDTCCMQVSGRHYCMTCMEHDDALMMALEKEVFHTARKTKSQDTLPNAPQKMKDIPKAIWSMCTNSSAFFATAKDSPFGLTFLLALIAVIPNKIGEAVRIEEMRPALAEKFEKMPEVMQSFDVLCQTPVEMRCAGACISAVIQVVLLDLLLFACVRGIAHSRMTFRETGTILHYCLLPLIFTGIGTFYNIPVVSFVALCLMIVILTTAVRVSSRCTFFQGVGIMLIFIFLTNITGLLRFYGI